MDNSLSLAKITRPGLPKVYLRTRLFEWLDQARERQMIWVAGPPGAGKTTLMCSYLENRDIQCLWYQVDHGDADIATFFHYLGLAGKKAAPRKRKALPHFTPEYLADLPTFSRRFFQDLFQRIKPPFALVLDNYQEVAVESALHQAVLSASSEIPEGGMVIIVSRSNPPPVLARTYANQGMALLGWQDLSLTTEETKAIASLRGIDQSAADSVSQLHDRAEGWVAGLILMLEGLKSGRPTPEFPGDRATDSLFDYFAGEILAHTDQKTREFLMQSAFLPSMTADMAAALTGNNEAKRILVELSRNYYFTEKLAHSQPVYQYHPLFREFLLAQAYDNFGEASVNEIQCKAAQILLQQDQVEDAVPLLRETRNWEQLARLIHAQARPLLEQGRGRTLEEWLRGLPEPMLENAPWLLYWMGACRLPFNVDESRSYFEKAFALFKKEQEIAGVLLAWSGAVETYLYEWGNFAPLDGWIAALDELMQRLDTLPEAEIGARVTASMFSALMYRQPEHPDFAVWEERARNLVESNMDLRHRITVGSHLIYYYSLVGDLAKAAVVLDVLRPAIRGEDIAPFTLIVWYCMEALYSWLTLENDACMRAVEAGLQTARSSGVHMWDFMLYAQGMYLTCNNGELDKAERFLEQMGAVMNPARRLDAAHYHYQAASLALQQGDTARALEHAEICLARADESGSPFSRTMARLGLAQVLFERGDDERALEYLSQTKETNRGLNSRYMRSHYFLLLAYFNLERYREHEAVEHLRRGMSMAREHGLVTMTWWRRDVMAKLCCVAIKHGVEVQYARQLIGLQGLAPDNEAMDLESWPWPIKIFTLGRFSLVVDGEPVRFSARAQSKPLEMLKALIALGGREVSEHKLVEALWPDAEGDAAHRAFDTTLHRLRKLLQSDRALVLQEGRLTLDTRFCWVDVWVFQRLLGELDRVLREDNGEPGRAELIDKGLGLYQGPFLDEMVDASWAIPLRDKLHTRFLRQLGAAERHWAQTGDTDKAIECCQQALAVDPLAEEFYQRLMRHYQKRGCRAEAVNTYHRCETVLSTQLGVSPSPATEAVYKKIISEQ